MSFSESVLALIERTWAGDAEAFEKLYHVLYRFFVNYIGDCDAACDMAQETIIKAWEKWPSVNNVSFAKKWLFTIATNHAIDYLRKKKSRYSVSPLENNDKDQNEIDCLSVSNREELPDEYILHAEEKRLVRCSIASVSPKYRDSLILYIVENITQKEIATLLGKDVRTIQRHIHLGKEELRQAFLRLSNGEDID